MASNYRQSSIEERFFGHTTIVNVPVIATPANLPEAYAAAVDSTLQSPDLTLSRSYHQVYSSKLKDFVLNHWGKILTGVLVAGVGYWYYKKQKEQENKVAIQKS